MLSYEQPAKPPKLACGHVSSELKTIEATESLNKTVADLKQDDPTEEEGKNVCAKLEVSRKSKSSKPSKQ